ncbi:MAG: MMPL family transporter [Thermococcus sp.]|nr:MMPL family transporter [Thermococcus sp.]
MAWNEWIAKHPKTVLAIWVVLILILAPFAAKISELTDYSTEQMVSHKIESIKVQDIISEEFAEAQNKNMTYLIITNISVNDENARNAYYAFKNRVEGRYATNVTSYYDALDMLWDMDYNLTLNITQMTANITGLLYKTVTGSEEGFEGVLNLTYYLKNTTEMTKNSLVGAAQGYLTLKNNLTSLWNQMILLRDALNQTDSAYVALHRNLTSTSEMLKGLNSTLAAMNEGLYTLNATYGPTYAGVIGVHKVLLQIGAYDRGNITPQEAQTIASQRGTTPELVYAVFNAVYPVYAQGGSLAVTDTLLANVTKAIVLTGTPDEQKFLVEAYGTSFYFGVEAFDEKAGSPYALQSLNASQLMATVSEIASQTLLSLPNIIAQSNQTVSVPGFGTLDAQTFASIVETAESLGPNPAPDAVENATVQIALALMTNMPENPLAGVENPEEVLRTLLVKGPTPELETELLISGMAGMVNDTAGQLVPLLVQTVMTYDPTAEGVLSKDTSILQDATLNVVEQMLSGTGFELDKNVLKAIYESNGDETVLEGLAKKLLKVGIVEQLGSSVPDAEKIAEKIVEVVAEDPEGIISGERLEEATIKVIESMSEGMAPEGVELNVSEIVKKLYEGADPKTVAEDLFLKGAEEQMNQMNTTAIPEEFKGVFMNLTRAVVENYPLSDKEIENLVKETVLSMISSYAKSNPYGVELKFNETLLADIAFHFKDNPNVITREDVKPLAEELWPVVKEKAGTYLDMLKSKDNTTILITFVPFGEPGPETDKYLYRAQNATKVKEIALEEFRKYFPDASGALGGTPVESHEMTEYGKKDNQRTSQASIIGALVVLFILMGGALLATLLPFTGVATSALTALGIAYLLTKGGLLNIGSWAQMLTITTALGLGIDYSTYYVHRFKEYIAEGYDHEKAVAEALKRAKDAVLASAFTDIIAFASFVLAWEFPIFQQIGIIIPLAVIAVLLASLTLIPAITALIGDKPIFWWPRHIKHVETLDVHERSRIAEWVVKHAKVVLLIGLLIAVPATYTFFTFEGTHDMSLFLPEGSETLTFMQLSQEKLGAAITSPNYVIIDLGHNITDDDLKVIDEITAHITTMEGVKAVYSPTRPYGEPVSNLTLSAVKALGGERFISSSGDKVMIQIDPVYKPTDDRAKELVKALRSYMAELEKEGKIKEGLVGGGAALSMDLTSRINDIFWHRIIPVALVLMFLSLIPTLKGLPAVVSTMMTIFLGVMTSIWVSTWLFGNVFNKEVMWFLPLLVFVVLMGVGIDYNSFYLVKARDEFERRSPKDALVVAAGTMDTLVIGLAIVLASTYGALMLSSTWGMREIGFALAAGVLLTATMAVYFIGPAFMSLFGEKAWWPLFKNHKEAKKD